MKLFVNNGAVETSANDLAALVSELKLPERGIAVALDGNVVPREAWAATPLREDARILIIRAACGG